MKVIINKDFESLPEYRTKEWRKRIIKATATVAIPLKELSWGKDLIKGEQNMNKKKEINDFKKKYNETIDKGQKIINEVKRKWKRH